MLVVSRIQMEMFGMAVKELLLELTQKVAPVQLVVPLDMKVGE